MDEDITPDRLEVKECEVIRPVSEQDRNCQAAGFMRYGPPEVIETLVVPVPAISPDEVLVEVVAAPVNPSDTLMRAGKQAAMMGKLSPPFIPGMEFAGHVQAVGSSVRSLSVGQPVMGVVNPRRPTGGAHSQLISVSALSAVALEMGVDLVNASTIPMNGLTAQIALDLLALPHGGVLLVTGGTGVVGGYSIQLAREAGLTVVADADLARADVLRRLGADVVVERGRQMGAEIRKVFPHGVDGLIDAALLGAPAVEAIRDGGVAVYLRGANVVHDPRVISHVVMVTDRMNDQLALVELRKKFIKGLLKPPVVHALPMNAAARAHRCVEERSVSGRVVLLLEDNGWRR